MSYLIPSKFFGTWAFGQKRTAVKHRTFAHHQFQMSFDLLKSCIGLVFYHIYLSPEDEQKHCFTQRFWLWDAGFKVSGCCFNQPKCLDVLFGCGRKKRVGASRAKATIENQERTMTRGKVKIFRPLPGMFYFDLREGPMFPPKMDDTK